MNITIVGAGIGGLTAAIALKQKGIDVEIFEAAPKFKKAGSGINLAINAMQVYKQMGLYDIIFEAGSYTRTMNITDEQLRPLSAVNSEPHEKTFKVKSVAIHRAVLHQILLEQLSDVPIHLNKKVKSLSESDEGIDIEFEDGSSHRADILLGADGIHSAVRKSIFPDSTIRNANQICWRGITDLELPEKYQTELNESWGKGKRFGFVAIGKNQYYWYALATYAEDNPNQFVNINLANMYSDFHPLVGKIINSTAKENILVNDMLDLKPIPVWHKNNVCLLGDSAHATTPNLGQGACQAIESSWALANCLAQHDSPQSAFTEFQNIRIKKAQEIVNTSWRIGKISHLENKVLITLRNLVMRMTPKRIADMQSKRFFTIAN